MTIHLKDRDENDLVTLADINQMTGYRTPITDYQMLRKRGVHPISTRKNSLGGGDLNEYRLGDVLTALRDRISKRRSDMARAAAESGGTEK